MFDLLLYMDLEPSLLHVCTVTYDIVPKQDDMTLL